MYRTESRKILFIGITILLLIFSLFFFRKMEQTKQMAIVSERIEQLSNDYFQMSLCATSIVIKSGEEITIDWWYNGEDGMYYLFVPKTLEDRLSYVFNQYESILIDDEKVRPGDSFALSEGVHTVRLDSGEEILLKVMNSYNINTMFIETDLDDLTGIHESKQNFDTGSYLLFDSKGNVNCSGRLLEIRGRGNMTFDAADKKSYNIRMKDKTAVLDLGIARGWALLANAFDESLVRNQLVTELANSMDMAYVPDMDYVDLYINGEYQGNYQLTEKVEISEERLNIRNLEKEMQILNPELDFDVLTSIEEPVDDFLAIKWVEGIQTPQNINNGYLMELDMTYRYYEEQSGFITSRKQPVVIKSPSCVSFEQAYYVANKYQDMENALCSEDGYNEATGLYYNEYLDMRSFAQKYLIDEISKNLDAALTSFFMYIPENDGIFYAGPIWDYDRTFGVGFERSGVDLMDPCTLYVSENIYFEESDVNIFHLLCQQEEFQNLYKQMYFEEVREYVNQIAENYVDAIAQRIESSAMMDAIRCGGLCSTTDVEANREEFRNYNQEVKVFIQKRIRFLDEEWK